MASPWAERPAVAVTVVVCAVVLWSIVLRMREDFIAQRDAAAGPVRNADAPGELMLRVGEGYAFGVGPRPRSERDVCDVYCLDILLESCDLRCPSGSAQVLEPVTSAGLPETAAAAAALIVDAPRAMPQRELTLLTRPRPNAAGLGFLRTRDGATLALWLKEVVDDPDVTARQVRIGYAPVPVADGGGALRLPRRAGVPSDAVLRSIRTARAFGRRMPNRGLVTRLDGEFRAVDTDLAKWDEELRRAEVPALPGECRVGTGLFDFQLLTIAELTDQHVSLFGGTLFVGSLGRDASIELHGYGAVGVAEDLVGFLSSDANAYLFVGDDVYGRLTMRGQTTAVVLGNVHGSILLRGKGDLFVRGEILGTLDCEGAGECGLFLQAFRSRADLEQMGGSNDVTVYVNLSDLPPGRHEGIGRWRAVVAGGAWWEQLVR
jgi:hypothetical protein